MTPAVKAGLQDLSKVRSLGHKNVFVRVGQPYTYEPVRSAFKKAVKDANQRFTISRLEALRSYELADGRNRYDHSHADSGSQIGSHVEAV